MRRVVAVAIVLLAIASVILLVLPRSQPARIQEQMAQSGIVGANQYSA